VVLIWDTAVELSKFAGELTHFRENVSEIEGIRTTITTLSGIDKILDDAIPQELPPQAGDFIPTSIPGTKKIITKSKKLDPLGRAQLLEFLGRLNSYYGRRESKSSFHDMVGINYSISSLLDQLEGATKQVGHSLSIDLSEIIDLANNALYQRYAGLETHFEICKHLPFPFLRGISGFIAAASCVPCFIFRKISPHLKIHEVWPGFVLFGLSYSYQLMSGRILSYPASFLDKPIEDWWGITHEVAHAYYWSSRFYEDQLPADIKRYLSKISPSKEIRLTLDIEEIYAQWFDFRYIFAGDVKRYFPMIWKSWLRWERIWRLKVNYVFRSLAIFLMTDLNGFYDAQNIGVLQTIEYLKDRYDKMRNIIISGVPEFSEFVRDLTSEIIEEMCEFLIGFEGYLNFLEKRCFKKEIFDALNPPYSEISLNKHIRSLEKGLIVIDDIPNPSKLLHKLYGKYPGSNNKVPLRTTGATILTLWYKYIKEYRT
jgi:hypothetical protein